MLLNRLLKGALLTAALASAAFAPPVLADNDTSAEPGYLPPNGSHRTDIVSGTGGSFPSRWYVSTLKGGRSYCLDLFPTAASAGFAGIVRPTFFQGGALEPFTGWVSNRIQHPQTSMIANGPMVNNAGGNRYCIELPPTPSETVVVFIQVTSSELAATTSTVSFSVALLDTTLYCPWFLTSANYEAFTQIQNVSSGDPIAGTLTHYAAVGTTGGSTTTCGAPVPFSVPAFSSTFVQAKATAGCTGGGGGKITHTGPPGAIKANVTSVNATGVGLTHSFNLACSAQYDVHGLAE
jgi:hypothetical protein